MSFTFNKVSTFTMSSDSVQTGDRITFSISRYNSSNTHTLRYEIGSKTGIIAENVGTSFTWTVPTNLDNVISDSSSVSGVIILETRGPSIGGKTQKSFTITFSNTAKPTFSGIRVSDINTSVKKLLGDNTFLQVLSNIRVDFLSAQATKGATITSYNAEIVGKNNRTTQNGGSLGIMNYSGQITIRASVTDSRGRTSDVREVRVNVLEYFAPVLSFDVKRTGSSSSTLTVNRNAKIAPIRLNNNQKNVMSLTFKIAEQNSTNFAINNGGATGNWTSIHELINSQANLSGNYVANKSWVLVGILEDKFTRSEFSVIVPTESVVFSYDKNGVGVNKTRERGALDVRGESYFSEHMYGKNDTPLGHYSRGANLTNLNDAITAGFYTVNNNTTNQPNNMKTWGILEVTVAGDSVYNGRDNWIWQTYTTTGGEIYKRHRINSGNWTDWKKTAFDNGERNDLVEREIAFPYGLRANMIRKGNVVTVTIVRAQKSIGVHHHSDMPEKIPHGFRPLKDSTLIISGTSKTSGVYHFTGNIFLQNNGNIAMTNTMSSNLFWTGTATYITNDPYP